MNSADALERKIVALERIYSAQSSGLLAHTTIMTLDGRGQTEEGAARVLDEELCRRGLSVQDFADAGLELIHLNLWWAEGRNVTASERAQEWLRNTT